MGRGREEVVNLHEAYGKVGLRRAAPGLAGGWRELESEIAQGGVEQLLGSPPRPTLINECEADRVEGRVESNERGCEVHGLGGQIELVVR